MSEDQVNQGRRRFLIASTSAVGSVGVAGAVVPFVASWRPSARARAAGAPVTVDLGPLEPGQMMLVEWRGKPVYVVHRRLEQLAALPGLDSDLADPRSERPNQPEYITEPFRSLEPRYLVLVGLCTHLGCAPRYRPEEGASDLGANWRGGFFCPCHGSRFDLAGRVYLGAPAAPDNLLVPPHRYQEEQVLVIGEDQEASA